MLRLKIRKKTFNEKEAWIVLEDDGGNYCGTWHTQDKRVAEYIRLKNPMWIDFKEESES